VFLEGHRFKSYPETTAFSVKDDNAAFLHIASKYNLPRDFTEIDFHRLGLKALYRIDDDKSVQIFPFKRIEQNNSEGRK
jgi:hypothetical protein